MAIIPPIGTSAYKAYQWQQRTGSSPTSVIPAAAAAAYKSYQSQQRTGSSPTSVIPPAGTSAYKAYQWQQRTGSSPTSVSLRDVVSSALEKVSPLPKPFFGFGSSGGGSASSDGSVASPELDYYQAALASHYGMDASTAYQEALANTSYQRSVQDMLNAGLNPASLFAAGRVSGADGVGYATQIGSGFGGSSGGGGSARSKYVFGKGLYQALQVVGGGLAVAATKRPSSYFAGQSAAKGIMQAINGFFR